MPIRVLPPHVAARIAAGEVVERPASVVKELVENALDSGSRKIEISVRGSGLQRISVSDDGAGMPPSDIALALVRHATSKLVGDDLLKVSTLGYRGEALPSIAAVATVRITSRPAGQDVAFSVSADSSGLRPAKPSAGREGTRVDVEGLFAAHPARLKFLKSDRAEAAAVRDTLSSLALSRHDAEIRCDVNGVESWYPPRNSFAERARDVLGMPEGDLVEVQHEDGGMLIEGVISLPSVSRSSGMFRFCVNGRPVSDKVMRQAALSAYSSVVGPGALPAVCLSLRLPADRVDVNVHPRKAEIRFRRPDEVSALVTRAVEKALSGAGMPSPSALAGLARTFASRSAATDNPIRRPLGRFMGQASGSWLVCETVDGIAIIDQHAAHERVVMERLRSAILSGTSEPVALDRPYTAEVAEIEAAAINDYAADFAAFGIQVEARAGRIILKSRPAALASVQPGDLCAALVRCAVEDRAGAALAEALWERLATAACKAAIKAGEQLSPERADALLREMETTPNAAWCNHGRPTVVFLKDADLGKLFSR